MQLRSFLLVLLPLILAACSPLGKEAAVQIADQTSSSVACKAADSHFFNHLYSLPLDEVEFPSSDLVESELRQQLQSDFELGILRTQDKSSVDRFVAKYMELYELATVRLPQELNLKSNEEVVAAMAALEMGDRTTSQKKSLQLEWEKLKPQLLQAAQELEGDCAVPTPEEPGAPTEPHAPQTPDVPKVPEETIDVSLLDYLKMNYSSPVFGAMKTVAVAYQSCGSLMLPPMDGSSPSVVGIEVYGRHSNGSGNLRRVASLSDVIRTHYYIRNETHPQNSCANLKQNPLIYDYGGKPGASSSMTSDLDIFRNAGTGSSELGIDCSGYVFTAYATAGLKLRADQPLKAIQVFGVSAGMMKEPQSNGLSCLTKVSGDLNPGDLIASTGHIVMVDSVGADPFGIANIKKPEDCTLSNMSPDRYDFVISQSSPSKGAIGINRMQASEYFPSASSSYREGFKYYAVSACKKKFGITQSAGTSQLSLVRHKGTSSCKDEPVKLAKQECLDVCRVDVVPTKP